MHVLSRNNYDNITLQREIPWTTSTSTELSVIYLDWASLEVLSSIQTGQQAQCTKEDSENLKFCSEI